jgi:hypothetical protein
MMNAIELSVKSGDETMAFGMYIITYRILGTIPGAKIIGKHIYNLDCTFFNFELL